MGDGDLSPQKAADQKPDGESKPQTINQVLPPVGEATELFDNIFKLLAGVAFVAWMVQEWVLPHNKFFLFIAIVCGLADAFYLLAHKILPRRRWLIVFIWVTYGICICLIAANSEREKHPHLQFGLAQATTNFVWLTNDFLMAAALSNSESWSDSVIITNSSPWLIVPTLGTQTNIVLWPLLSNGPEVDAEHVLVRIIIGSEVSCLVEDGWSVHRDGEHNTELLWKSDFCPKNGSWELPRLTFSGPFPNDKRWDFPRSPVIVTVEAKNAPPIKLLFWMVFVAQTTNNINMAVFDGSQLDFKTNGDIQFNLSKDQMKQLR